MDATEFINTLNDGKKLDNMSEHVIIYQEDDILTIITSVTITSGHADAWAISESGKRVEIYDNYKRIATIDPRGFQEMTE